MAEQLLVYGIDEGVRMIVATVLMLLVVVCLLLSMLQKPPAIGR